MHPNQFQPGLLLREGEGCRERKGRRGMGREGKEGEAKGVEGTPHVCL